MGGLGEGLQTVLVQGEGESSLGASGVGGRVVPCVVIDVGATTVTTADSTSTIGRVSGLKNIAESRIKSHQVSFGHLFMLEEA